ncbi:MAG TPA: hypothetical protein VKP67_14635 [Xanthobacteraceae bacterium]|nr:hypothetical protein [Xanthobacteraceae bacterium]
MDSSVEIFTKLCKAEALLWQSQEKSLHDAVDWLQAYAVDNGLVADIGQDEVQRIIGSAFAAVRDDLGGWRP